MLYTTYLLIERTSLLQLNVRSNEWEKEEETHGTVERNGVRNLSVLNLERDVGVRTLFRVASESSGGGQEVSGYNTLGSSSRSGSEHDGVVTTNRKLRNFLLHQDPQSGKSGAI